jgi:phosphoglycolate phosphatase
MHISIQQAIQSIHQAQAVLFDWDGTLVNSADFVPDIHSQILSRLSIPLDAAVIKEKLGISQTALIEMALKKNGKAADDATIKLIIPDFVSLEDEIFDEYYADGRIHLKAGALEFLAYLRQQKIPMAIVSNAYDNVTHKRLNDTGLMDVYFSKSDVFGRTRIGTTKPNPQQIIVACKTLGCAPQDAIFFGDTQSDRGACDAAGISMIQIGHGELAPPSFATLDDFTGLVSSTLRQSPDLMAPRP